MALIAPVKAIVGVDYACVRVLDIFVLKLS